MHKLNLLFTLTSISVILVTIERFSFTTKILLQPYNFLRLHEVVQISLIILVTVIIPFFILYLISDKFQLFSKKNLFWLPLLFVIGVYFYSTGNGLHEVASFTLNQYCNPHSLKSILCQGLFFNDYYTGNILYFIGGILMTIALLFTEKIHPNKTYSQKDVIVTIINALFYSLAIFAYAAFDPVLVGLVYSLIITILVLFLFFKIRRHYLSYPITFYTLISYTVGTIAAFIVRFH
ncbi:MAG TPA: hypothetical protein VLF93_07055 [Candidatus Saccharimonadales bacterium]|nr:hypothetical protein [Candidatus Saccharimonadales bacterium]